MGRGGTPQIHENFDFCRIWPRGGLECAQNDATGCGNTFHTQQTQFWGFYVSTFFGPTFRFRADISLSCTNQSPMAVGFKPTIPTYQGVNRLQPGHSGFLPSSTWTPETGTSTPVGTPCQNPNSVGTPCQSSHSPNTGIPAPGCEGIKGFSLSLT